MNLEHHSHRYIIVTIFICIFMLAMGFFFGRKNPSGWEGHWIDVYRNIKEVQHDKKLNQVTIEFEQGSMVVLE